MGADVSTARLLPDGNPHLANVREGTVRLGRVRVPVIASHVHVNAIGINGCNYRYSHAIGINGWVCRFSRNGFARRKELSVLKERRVPHHALKEAEGGGKQWVELCACNSNVRVTSAEDTIHCQARHSTPNTTCTTCTSKHVKARRTRHVKHGVLHTPVN